MKKRIISFVICVIIGFLMHPITTYIFSDNKVTKTEQSDTTKVDSVIIDTLKKTK